MTDTERGGARERTRAEETTSVWEWIIAAVSTLLVFGAIGFIFYRAVTEDPVTPRISVQVDTIVQTESGYAVEFWARNHGDATAKGLSVEGQLVGDTGVLFTRSTTLDFVPGESRRRGGLFFPVDPRRYELRLYPVGYDRP